MSQPQSFKEAYHILKSHADRLEHGEDIDIDNLIDIVDESIQAYKYCHARIDAVELALNQTLNSHQPKDKNNESNTTPHHINSIADNDTDSDD